MVSFEISDIIPRALLLFPSAGQDDQLEPYQTLASGIWEAFLRSAFAADSGRLHLWPTDSERPPAGTCSARRETSSLDIHTIITRQDGGSNQGPQCEDSLKPLHRLPLLDP